MSSSNTMRKLLKTSLSRKTNKKLFASLLEQHLARESISDTQLGETLINLAEFSDHRRADRASAERLQTEYAVEFAISSPENLKRFFKILSQTSHRCQCKYISFFKGQLAHLSSKQLMGEFKEELASFTIHLEAAGGSTADSKRLWYGLIFLWSALIHIDRALFQHDSFKKAAAAIKRTVKASKDPQIGAFVAKNFGASPSLNGSSTDDHHINKQDATGATTGKTFSLNQHGKKYSVYTALKKFIWLNEHFRQWNFHSDVTRSFTRFFQLQDLGHRELAQELIHTFFNGFATAAKSDEKNYVVFNWRNFILTNLILDVKGLAPTNSRASDEWCNAIVSAVNACSDDLRDISRGSDLAREFLRGCIYEEVVTLEKFLTKYPNETHNLSASLISHEKEKLKQTSHLASEFSSKLGNVNMEFTSLEESQLIEYFRNLTHTDFKFSVAKQQKLSSLMEDLIGTLIREKNNEKLSWVTLILSNVPAIANYMFYQSARGPWMFLRKIIKYIDNEYFEVDEDDGNFQDTYACFGVLLTGVISVSTLFGIEISALNIKSSYTIDFVNGFFFRQFDTLTDTYNGSNDQEKQIIANYEKLSTEWANALFDENNDGLSDDLLKSVGVKQIYKFIIILFRQAFTARSAGVLSETSLNNGIDYLSQNFLAPCSLESIQWICSRIGPLHESNEKMIEIVLRIVESNIGDSSTRESSSPNYTFRMILNVIGPELMRKLSSLDRLKSSENAVRLKKIIMNETDAEYCRWNVPAAARSLDVPLPSIKDEISALTRDSKPDMTNQISDVWRKINKRWNCGSVSESFHVLLEEARLCVAPRGLTVLDESKLAVDFYAFMLVSSSSPDAENCRIFSNDVTTAGDTKSSSVYADPKFSSTINDHTSSIFNEDFDGSTSKEPTDEDKPQSRDDAMEDFEMGDLFDDMSDNFFGDSFTKPSAEGEFTNELDSVDMESFFKQVAANNTPLRLVSHLMTSSVFGESKNLCDVLQTRLTGEVQKWKVAHGY